MRHAVEWLGRHGEKSFVSLADDERLMATHLHMCCFLHPYLLVFVRVGFLDLAQLGCLGRRGREPSGTRRWSRLLPEYGYVYTSEKQRSERDFGRRSKLRSCRRGPAVSWEQMRILRSWPLQPPNKKRLYQRAGALLQIGRPQWGPKQRIHHGCSFFGAVTSKRHQPGWLLSQTGIAAPVGSSEAL